MTQQRAEVLIFTDPYTKSPTVAAVHQANTSVKDVKKDLDGKKIGVCGGCVQEKYIGKSLEIPGQKLDFVIDGATAVPYNGADPAYQDLALGDGVRLDAVLFPASGVCTAKRKGAPIKIVGEPIFYEVNAVAFDKTAAKSPASLATEVNKILGDMNKEGLIRGYSQKWYKYDQTAGQLPPDC